jgi:hypothetical protein
LKSRSQSVATPKTFLISFGRVRDRNQAYPRDDDGSGTGNNEEPEISRVVLEVPLDNALKTYDFSWRIRLPI